MRARRRAQQYGAEKVLDAFLNGPHPTGAVLRHGNTLTFYRDGKPACSGSMDVRGSST